MNNSTTAILVATVALGITGGLVYETQKEPVIEERLGITLQDAWQIMQTRQEEYKAINGHYKQLKPEQIEQFIEEKSPYEAEVHISDGPLGKGFMLILYDDRLENGTTTRYMRVACKGNCPLQNQNWTAMPNPRQ